MLNGLRFLLHTSKKQWKKSLNFTTWDGSWLLPDQVRANLQANLSKLNRNRETTDQAINRDSVGWFISITVTQMASKKRARAWKSSSTQRRENREWQNLFSFVKEQRAIVAQKGKQSRALNWVREDKGRMIGTIAGFIAHLTINMASTSHPWWEIIRDEKVAKN